MKVVSSILIIIIFSSLQLVSQIRINEVCASNSESQFDEDSDTPDWIELYNSGSEAVQLEDYFLSFTGKVLDENTATEFRQRMGVAT